MKLQHLAGLVASLSLVTAHKAADTLTPTVTGLLSATETRTDTDTFGSASATEALSSDLFTATAVPTSEACLAVSSALATQTAPNLYVDAQLANECQLSAPIVEEDALLLIDGILALIEFQSDLEQLKNPPADYPLAGVDLVGELQQIRDQVSSGGFTSEIEFQRNVTAVIGKAQDGHLSLNLDGISTFLYMRQFALVSVSSDGKEKPEIYLHDELVAYLDGTGAEPSAVTHVNGQEIVQFLQTDGQNVSYGGFQDPDALYNVEFWQLSNGGSMTDGYFSLAVTYKGESTTLTFANGSEATQPNYAVWNSNYPFTTLVDGASYYDICCNATAKMEYLYGSSSSMSGSAKDVVQEQYANYDKADVRPYSYRVLNRLGEEESKLQEGSNAATTSAVASASATATQLPGYPSPIALSSDLSFSGYFLDSPGFENTAVIVMTVMSETDPASFSQSMTTFMDACRTAKKTHLVIDVQGNGGGTVAIGYAIFKQLFPDLDPYGAGTLRAQEGLDILGNFYTNLSAQAYQEDPNNITLLTDVNYYQQYDPVSSLNDSGQPFGSWAEFYGPVDNGVDNYTNLIRWNLADTNYDEVNDGGFVIPGFGNSTALPPSPFTSENIVLLSNGLCSSTCTIFAHFMKWQGKVKSIAVGGRPDATAMQSVGGVKGSQVSYYIPLQYDVAQAYQIAAAAGYNDYVDSITNSKTLGNILNNGTYIILRGANAGVEPAARTDFGFNFQNNIAEGDASYTPLQFVYEAADCHLWYQPQHIGDITTLWLTTAAQAFGLNDTDVFSLCVDGSTNAPSSLSGNATLYNNGNPTNVTDFLPEENATGGSGHHNGVGRLAASSMVVAGAIAAAMFMM